MRPRASDEVAVDVSDAPSTSGGDGDLGFWQLLSGREIARPTHPAKGGVRSRVVLLHGWLMSHACWLNTATQLRDRYGHDVLLLDFPGHGRSPLLPEFTDHHPLAFAHNLRGAAAHVGVGARAEAGRRRAFDRSDRSRTAVLVESRDSKSSGSVRSVPGRRCVLPVRGRVSGRSVARRAGRVARLGREVVRAAEPLAPAPRRALHLALAVRARAAGASAGGWCPAGARPRTPRCRTCTSARHADVRRAARHAGAAARGRPHGAGVGRAGPVPHRADQALEGGQAARPRRAARAGTHRTHRRRSLRTRR